jgi:hypothetical protein
MGKLSTLTMVNEMGVISLTTYGALIYFMATIILKDEILLPDARGRDFPFKKIECSCWQRSIGFEGIEVRIENKSISIPINNVLAIIE